MLGHRSTTRNGFACARARRLRGPAAAGGLGAVAVGAYQSNLMLMGVLGVALVIWKSERVEGRTCQDLSAACCSCC